MKMKKYILPLLFCGALTLQGCNDFLDTNPSESYTEDLVWGSPSTAEAFILQTYNNVMPKYTDFKTEDCFTTNSIWVYQGCPSEVRELVDRSWNFGFGDFGTIRKCNLIIEKVGASNFNETKKKELVAEGKMLRAMTYYYQAKHTGRVIWVDRVLSETDNFALGLTSSIKESYDHILQDLDDAIAGLPEESAAGRLNRNAALALKSEVCLTAAAYTGQKELFQQAIDAVNAIQGYQLDANYEGMFNQDGAYSSPEIILGHYFSKDATTCGGTMMQEMIPNQNNDAIKNFGCSPVMKTDYIFECWMAHAPSQNLADNYLVIDRMTQQAVPWNESTQFKNNVKEVPTSEIASMAHDAKELTNGKGYISLNDTKLNELIYGERDKRFYATIVYDSCQFYGETITMCQKGNLNRSSRVGVPGTSHMPLTNYMWRKSIYNVSPRPFVDVFTDYHYVVFRLGRALMNKAEALLCLGKWQEAMQVINETRKVHGGLPGSTASNLQEAWDDYKRERNVELPLEGDYYWSLLRWGKYGKEANHGLQPSSVIPELNCPATFSEISKDRKRMFVGQVQFTNDQREFRTRRYLFPIPQGVINANPALSDADQNPEW